MTVVAVFLSGFVIQLTHTCGNGLHHSLLIRLHCSHLCIPGSGRDQFHPNILDPVCKVSSRSRITAHNQRSFNLFSICHSRSLSPGSATLSDCNCYATRVCLCLTFPGPLLLFSTSNFLLHISSSMIPTQHKIVRASGKIENPSKSHIGYLGWDCPAWSQ